jgi:hypothetical protein
MASADAEAALDRERDFTALPDGQRLGIPDQEWCPLPDSNRDAFARHFECRVSTNSTKGARRFIYDRAVRRSTQVSNPPTELVVHRGSREWTFNYYMTTANDTLLKLAGRWSEVTTVLSKHEKVTKGTTNSRRRWNRHQNAFEAAMDAYERDLVAALAVSTAKPKAKTASPSRAKTT